MSAVSRAFYLVYPILSRGYQSAIVSYYAKAMAEEIKDIKESVCSTADVNGSLLPKVTLPNGLVLIGQHPTKKQRFIKRKV